MVIQTGQGIPPVGDAEGCAHIGRCKPRLTVDADRIPAIVSLAYTDLAEFIRYCPRKRPA